jgi:hypothetical protein
MVYGARPTALIYAQLIVKIANIEKIVLLHKTNALQIRKIVRYALKG